MHAVRAPIAKADRPFATRATEATRPVRQRPVARNAALDLIPEQALRAAPSPPLVDTSNTLALRLPWGLTEVTIPAGKTVFPPKSL
jgi:hypothetical protein